jgi:hypothetical protein
LLKLNLKFHYQPINKTKVMPLNNWKKLIIALTIINIPFIAPKVLAQDAISIARQVTVKISEVGSNDQGGSGVIIGKKNGKYIIATNCHVIKNGGSYDIKTYVNRTYRINISNPLSLCHPQRTPEQVDLAFLQIPDDYNYPIAQSVTGNLRETQKVIAVGFSAKNGTTTQRIIEFQSGEINQINPYSALRGYALVHSAETFQGMSGGGIFNEQGQLIAISGETRPAQDLRPNAWRYFGILPEFYLNWLNNTNITFNSLTPSRVISDSNSTMFQKLETLLQARKWEDANTETRRVMLVAGNREQEGWWDINSISKLSCNDLQSIENLWVKYSGRSFNFYEQMLVYQNQENSKEYQNSILFRSLSALSSGDRIRLESTIVSYSSSEKETGFNLLPIPSFKQKETEKNYSGTTSTMDLPNPVERERVSLVSKLKSCNIMNGSNNN